MKKFLSAALAALLLVGALAGCSGSSAGENGELVLYTWENMFPQEVLDGFTEETGIQVTYSNFDTDEMCIRDRCGAGVYPAGISRHRAGAGCRV